MNRGWIYRERISAPGKGETALAYLARKYPHSTESEWSERFAAGGVRIAQHIGTPGEIVREGDVLEWHRPPWVEPDVPLSFEVIYEDADVLAVSKPSGLPTVPAGGFLEHTLLALVRARDPEADPMHRLGRGTSGIVLFARSELARRELAKAWRDRTVKKLYRALAAGVMERDRFTIDAPIGVVPHALLGDIFASNPAGKQATSHFEVVTRGTDRTLVDVEIETGRPHQIRIHAAFAGHPLVGDPLYGIGGKPRQDAVPGDLGYLLHARLLEFAHPRTGLATTIECEAPPGFGVSAE